MTIRSDFPVAAILPDVVATLKQGSSVVIKAPTGAGKTTQVPVALLQAGFAERGSIVVLEPRRLAAQSSARWMAAEHGEPVGRTIGYHIRFDRQAGRDTRLLVVTEGIFLRMLLDDPLLEQVAVVVFDEFHERNLQSDLALALCQRIQTDFRPELKLVVMSATLDPAVIARFLHCPVMACEGRRFPVEVQYLRYPSQRPLHVEAADGARALAEQTSGDVLVFLPGVGEIRRTRGELQRSDGTPWNVLELYGELPPEQQDAVLRPGDRRKIILATNVAETSVTIPGVTGVVDSGYARSLRCDHSVGLNRLELVRISRASADQRMGRAGRTEPGVCLRLWSTDEWRLFPEHELPEILRLDLASAILQLHAWGEADVRAFPWFQAPPAAAVEQAEWLLRRLGALDEHRITDLGKRLAQFPVHPRLARLLIAGQQLQCIEPAALAAALLSERDPFARESSRQQARPSSPSDVLDRVHAVEAFARSGTVESEVGSLRGGAAEHILRVQRQLLREMGAGHSASPSPNQTAARGSAAVKLLRALVAAYPDRVARRRDPNSSKGVMVGGRGVRLSDSSAVRDSQLFLCVDIEEVGSTEALVRQASRVERAWLPPERVASRVEVEFDAERERVVAFLRARYDDLLLEEAATDAPDSEETAELLAAAAAAPGMLARALPLDEEPVSQFLARVASLREWMPELALPEIGEEAVRSLLPQLARGRRSFAELRKAPLLSFLQGLLSAAQFAAVQREAPEWIAAASGSRIRLRYSAGRPPVMPVRIQEMFGQLDTPRIAAGRVPVLLHLLAPNMRPQQVTDDLRGFWERAYPIVRKELRRRYPKHAWPDDPAHASPERRPKRP